MNAERPREAVAPAAEEAKRTTRHSARWKGGETLALYGAVGLGSMIGGVLRALVSSAGVWGPALPLGTLFINVLGSFLIGFYATLTGPGGRIFAGPRQRQFVMVGFCGGFTTFSMFTLETLMLVEDGRPAAAGLYVVVSIVSWLAAVWLGHVLALRLNRLRGSER